MNGLSNDQRDRLLELSLRVRDALDTLWDAFETGSMSDAKSAVYTLKDRVSSDDVMPAGSRTEMLGILEAAWTLIVSGGATSQERARASHGELAKAERYLHRVLAVQQDTSCEVEQARDRGPFEQRSRTEPAPADRAQSQQPGEMERLWEARFATLTDREIEARLGELSVIVDGMASHDMELSNEIGAEVRALFQERDRRARAAGGHGGDREG